MMDQITVADSVDTKLLNLYIKIQSKQSEGTAKNYASTIREFVSTIPKPLNQVTLDDIVVYAESIEHLAVSTQHRKLSTLKSLYQWIGEAQPGYLRANPLAAYKLPKMTKKRTVERFMSEDEIKRLLEIMRYRNYRNYVFAQVMYVTGARISELVDAKWSDLFRDLDGEYGLTITGKGNKQRVVGIPQNIFRRIVEYRKRNNLPHILDELGDTPIFPNRDGNTLTPRYMEREIAAAGKIMGKHITPHYLRHSMATHALYNGANIYQVQHQLGHESLRTTEVYLHTVNRLKDGATKYINCDFDD